MRLHLSSRTSELLKAVLQNNQCNECVASLSILWHVFVHTAISGDIISTGHWYGDSWYCDGYLSPGICRRAVVLEWQKNVTRRISRGKSILSLKKFALNPLLVECVSQIELEV